MLAFCKLVFESGSGKQEAQVNKGSQSTLSLTRMTALFTLSLDEHHWNCTDFVYNKQKTDKFSQIKTREKSSFFSFLIDRFN